MNFSSKNLVRFLLGTIGFTACFGFLFRSIWIGLLIGLFLSIGMFYDPKKYTAAKKKAEQAALEENNIDKTDLD